MTVELIPTLDDERENFAVNLQTSFQKAADEELGNDNDEEIISRDEIFETFNMTGAQVLNILCDGKIVGGAVVIVRPTNINELSLFFINVDCRGKGIGYVALCAIEKFFPNTKIWELSTPHFAKRNLHFYINKCGFHAVEFFGPLHPSKETDEDYFFRFEKVMER